MVVGRGLHRLLVARRERAQRVLHAVAELAEHGVGNVERVLRDEVHADALRADQPHDLLDLVEQRLRRVVEQQVRLVEEEHELRLVGVADLGQLLEQLRQQPQQERRVEPRRLHQLVGGEDVDDAAAVRRSACRSSMLSIGSPKNLSPPCCSSASRPRWIAPIAGGARRCRTRCVNLLRVVADVLQHRAQVLQVEQQQAVVVGDLEHQLRARPACVSFRLSMRAEQQRAHVGDGGAHRMALLAEHVPERRPGRRANAGASSVERFSRVRRASAISAPGWRDAGEVALDVGHEHRHADRARSARPAPAA